mgnify:CR=1 FL=1
MKRNLSIATLLLLTFFMVRPAVSADWNKGLDAYANGDYAAAMREWKPLAEQGDTEAQSQLGQMYANGKGVVQDYKMAVKWFKKAAEQGHTSAQNSLGFMYDKGQGVLQDYTRAHMWFNIVASSRRKQAAKNRDKVAKKMSSSQIEKAQDLARQCIKEKYKNC